MKKIISLLVVVFAVLSSVAYAQAPLKETKVEKEKRESVEREAKRIDESRKAEAKRTGRDKAEAHPSLKRR